MKQAGTGYYHDLNAARGASGGKLWTAPRVLIREDVSDQVIMGICRLRANPLCPLVESTLLPQHSGQHAREEAVKYDFVVKGKDVVAHHNHDPTVRSEATLIHAQQEKSLKLHRNTFRVSLGMCWKSMPVNRTFNGLG